MATPCVIWCHFRGELDGRMYTVEVVQDYLCSALIHNAAGVIGISLPNSGFHWGSAECKLLKELHVEVDHCSRWVNPSLHLTVQRRLLHS